VFKQLAPEQFCVPCAQAGMLRQSKVHCLPIQVLWFTVVLQFCWRACLLMSSLFVSHAIKSAVEVPGSSWHHFVSLLYPFWGVLPANHLDMSVRQAGLVCVVSVRTRKQSGCVPILYNMFDLHCSTWKGRVGWGLCTAFVLLSHTADAVTAGVRLVRLCARVGHNNARACVQLCSMTCGRRRVRCCLLLICALLTGVCTALVHVCMFRVGLPRHRGMVRVVCRRLSTRYACTGSCFALIGIFMLLMRASNLAYR
jgi:hypothetical protein